MVIFVICELLNLQFQLLLIEYAAFLNPHLLNVKLKAHTFYMPISESVQAGRQEEGIFIIPRECNNTIGERMYRQLLSDRVRHLVECPYEPVRYWHFLETQEKV